MTKEQFEVITEWQKQTFPNATPFSKIAHLEEEVSELYEAMHMHEPGESRQSIRHEFADCFFLLFGAAAAAGMSYEDCCIAIDEKFKINQARKWGKPAENGVVNHVKEDNPYLLSGEELERAETLRKVGR